jgi:iron transport multicopper oxidase
MLKVASFVTFLALSLLSVTHAAIGPITDLHIVNKNIAPDGFTRSYVYSSLFLTNEHSNLLIRAVLAEGTFPGPLIRGVKV